MSEARNGRPVRDRDLYVKNRAKFTPEDLLPYQGRWVAWSADGSRIVASHEEVAALVREIDGAGIDREDVVLDRIPHGGIPETIL